MSIQTRSRSRLTQASNGNFISYWGPPQPSTPPTSLDRISRQSLGATKMRFTPTPSLRNSATDLVTIIVIDTKANHKCFIVHRHFITHYSPFFNAAFNGRFTESASAHMEFETISAPAFGIFVDWVYNQRLEDGEGIMPGMEDLVNLWILADKILVPSLQNKVIQAIRERVSMKDDLPTHLFCHIYENTLEESPLRRIFVDMSIIYGGRIENDEYFPREMLVDIINSKKEPSSHKATQQSKNNLKKYFVSEVVPERRSGSAVQSSSNITDI